MPRSRDRSCGVCLLVCIIVGNVCGSMYRQDLDPINFLLMNECMASLAGIDIFSHIAWMDFECFRID